MATNLKQDKKAEARAAKGEKGEGGRRLPVSLQWLLAIAGLAVITMCSVIVGVKLSIDYFTNQTKTHTQYVKEIPPKPGPIFAIVNDQVVNLNGGRYLRFAVAMQFAQDDKVFPKGEGEGKKVSPLDPYEALIKDTIVTITSKHTANNLLDPSGKDHLKEEIKASINQQMKALAVDPDDPDAKAHSVPMVYKVFFTSFVIS